MTPIHEIDIRYKSAQAQNDCISSNDILSLEDIQSFCAYVNLQYIFIGLLFRFYGGESNSNSRITKIINLQLVNALSCNNISDAQHIIYASYII